MNLSVTEAFTQITKMYGEETITRPSVPNWFKRFENGNFTLDDKIKSGKLRELSREELNIYLENNSSHLARDLAAYFGVNNPTISRALNDFGKFKKFRTCVPKIPTESDRLKRFDASRTLLSMFGQSQNGYHNLENLITGDEKWITYENHENRLQWLDPEQKPTPRISKPLHPKKNFLWVWWNSREIIY